MATNTKKRSELKSYFVKNAIPTEGQFADLIDGQLNQADDGVFKSSGEPLSVVAGSGAQKRALQLYANYPAANPDWLISLNPAQNPADPATARPGFGVTDGAGNPRLFIDQATGNLGIGTNQPSDKLTVRYGDISIEGGYNRRLKVVSDRFSAGIELVSRSYGFPYIDFTNGQLDNPDFGIRIASPANNILTIQSGDGTANLDVQGVTKSRGAIYAGNSDLYFTNTAHNHTALGNSPGWAAIENASNTGALMILGRQTDSGRVVKLWDYLEINGKLKVTSNTDINGTLTVASNTNLNRTLTVASNTNLNGTLTVASNTNLNGALTVGGALTIGGWTLEPSTNQLYIKRGTETVARFSVHSDHIRVYQNLDGQAPYFYFNVNGNYGLWP